MGSFKADRWIYTSDWVTARRDFKQFLDIIFKGQVFGGKKTYEPEQIYGKNKEFLS